MRTYVRNAICLLTAIAFFLSVSISQVQATNEQKTSAPPADITAKGAVLIDMQSGQTLFDQNKDARHYPASITKIMTAILALEKGNLQDGVKTSKLAREQDGNRIYLEYDEVQTLDKLLYGLMLNSGNDAAVAIAEHIGGSVESFAEMMNAKAAELGMKNTHFVTPSGLHDDGHYTTPYDMALLGRYAMQNPKFREIVATQTMEWKGQVWESVLINLNRMLWEYPGATGVKTGFTDEAQQTIVVTAKRGDRELIAVLMHLDNKLKVLEESTRLLDYGFEQFKTEPLGRAGDVLSSFEQGEDRIDAVLVRDVYGTTALDAAANIEHRVTLSAPPAPYAKGTKVGTVTYLADGQEINTAPLFASRDAFPVKPTLLEKGKEHEELLIPLGMLLLFGVFMAAGIRRMRTRTHS